MVKSIFFKVIIFFLLWMVMMPNMVINRTLDIDESFDDFIEVYVDQHMMNYLEMNPEVIFLKQEKKMEEIREVSPRYLSKIVAKFHSVFRYTADLDDEWGGFWKDGQFFGDCEDYSLELASILIREKLVAQEDIVFLTVRSDKGGHAIIGVNIKGREYIIDYFMQDMTRDAYYKVMGYTETYRKSFGLIREEFKNIDSKSVKSL